MYLARRIYIESIVINVNCCIFVYMYDSLVLTCIVAFLWEGAALQGDTREPYYFAYLSCCIYCTLHQSSFCQLQAMLLYTTYCLWYINDRYTCILCQSCFSSSQNTVIYYRGVAAYLCYSFIIIYLTVLKLLCKWQLI